MERLSIGNDVVLWLSLLSVAIVCMVIFYDGVTGLAHLPSKDFTTMKMAFGASVYVLFILLPLLILDLVLEASVISEIVEWSTPVLYIAIVIDIILMTVFYLLM